MVRKLIHLKSGCVGRNEIFPVCRLLLDWFPFFRPGPYNVSYRSSQARKYCAVKHLSLLSYLLGAAGLACRLAQAHKHGAAKLCLRKEAVAGLYGGLARA